LLVCSPKILFKLLSTDRINPLVFPQLDRLPLLNQLEYLEHYYLLAQYCRVLRKKIFFCCLGIWDAHIKDLNWFIYSFATGGQKENTENMVVMFPKPQLPIPVYIWMENLVNKLALNRSLYNIYILVINAFQNRLTPRLLPISIMCLVTWS
jgi:hypothetical protein